MPHWLIDPEGIPISAIFGSGYGSKHFWVVMGTIKSDNEKDKATEYHCAKCLNSFFHRRYLIPDIFEAIKDSGVPEECVPILETTE